MMVGWEGRRSEGRRCLEEGCLGLPGVLPDICWTAIFPIKWRKRRQEPELPDLAWKSQTSFSKTFATTWVGQSDIPQDSRTIVWQPWFTSSAKHGVGANLFFLGSNNSHTTTQERGGLFCYLRLGLSYLRWSFLLTVKIWFGRFYLRLNYGLVFLGLRWKTGLVFFTYGSPCPGYWVWSFLLTVPLP